MKLEVQMRVAVRDAVNRDSRKLFYWGGLKGYQQLQAMAQVLQRLPSGAPETRYLQPLARQVCPDCASIDYLPIDTTTKFTLLIAGAVYYLIPSVRFSPNVEWVRYSAPADPAIATPKNDIVWRATFYWVW